MADAEFSELFGRAGCRGWLCVREVEGDGEVAYGADEPVAAASVFKIAVALEVYRQASAGALDPAERIRVRPQERTPGPTGLSVFADEAELSVRDLVTMMMTISDNAATDVLLDRVGLDRVRATLAGLGLPGTVIPAPLRDELDVIGRDAGFVGWAELERAAASLPADEERRVQQRMVASGALDPRLAIRTTARETATLLWLIWRDEAGPAAACAPVRQAMARQVTRQRLGPGVRAARIRGGGQERVSAGRDPQRGGRHPAAGRRALRGRGVHQGQPAVGAGARDQRRHRRGRRPGRRPAAWLGQAHDAVVGAAPGQPPPARAIMRQ